MTNAKRGRGSRHWVYFAVAAASGLALSGCGGGGGSSAAAASSTSTPSTVSAQSTSVGGATSAGDGTSASSGTSAGDGKSASTGTSAGKGTSASTGVSAGRGTSTSSTTGTDTSPTVHAESVTINWTPPTENTDGTPLTNLAGYDIHYGTSPGSLSQKITVSNPGIATYVVSSLSPGTYYFAVAAVNASGTESPLSTQVSATVTN